MEDNYFKTTTINYVMLMRVMLRHFFGVIVKTILG